MREELVSGETYNGKSQDGVSHVQVNQKSGLRAHASRCYLRGGLAPKSQLHVLTHARVRRVLIRNSVAFGVEHEHKGAMNSAVAHNEVILSAVTVASAKLLMLSGIGPRSDLARAGVEVLQHSPGVGANLQEQPTILQRWSTELPAINCLGPGGMVKGLWQWVRDGSGLLAATALHAQVMHRTDHGTRRRMRRSPSPTSPLCVRSAVWARWR
jgi:choline dehydrogenase-like flavoprotein